MEEETLRMASEVSASWLEPGQSPSTGGGSSPVSLCVCFLWPECVFTPLQVQKASEQRCGTACVSVRAVKSFLGLLVCHYRSHDASQVRADITAHNWHIRCVFSQTLLARNIDITFNLRHSVWRVRWAGFFFLNVWQERQQEKSQHRLFLKVDMKFVYFIVTSDAIIYKKNVYIYFTV